MNSSINRHGTIAAAKLRCATTQVPRGFSLGSHSCTHRWGFIPWGMLFVGAAIIFSILPPVHAQSLSCGATLQHSTNKLIYPPIARVAHIAGTVVLLIAFDHDGTVSGERAIAGPEMLKQIALDYAKGLHAESSPGSRECPFIVVFQIDNCENTPPIRSNGATVCAEEFVTIDESSVLGKRKRRFLIF